MVFETLNPAIAITLIAIIILVIINAFYRFLINQKDAQRLKDHVQELGKEAKKHKGDPDKQKALMKETMAEQNKLMKMNMKPMILSFVIVIILLPYLGAVYSDAQVPASDSPADFVLGGKDFTLTTTDGSISVSGDQSFDCDLPCRQVIDGNTWKIRSEGNDVRFELIVATLPGLPLVGGWELGWLWWYILVSIPFSLIIRALYGIKS